MDCDDYCHDGGGGDGLGDHLDDGDGDDESKSSPDDDEAVVIGQNVLLRGKSNRVPGKQVINDRRHIHHRRHRRHNHGFLKTSLTTAPTPH